MEQTNNQSQTLYPMKQEDTVPPGMGAPVAPNVPGIVKMSEGGIPKIKDPILEEIKKTEWYKEFTKEFGEPPDLETKDYDYRAAWKAGIRPVRDPHDKNRYHWASSDPQTGKSLKSENHPTAWKEKYMKQTGKNPDEVGMTKEKYEASKEKKFSTGGALFQTGGMLDEGGSVDPVSGNDVPVGSLKEEVRDDIPAKLSEGEFVFPADVVRFIGLDRLMKMRQLAKDGLAKMEAMGQMGNSEEATTEDDGDFESNIDELLEEIEQEESSAENQTERMMAEGGSVESKLAQANEIPKQAMKATEIIREDLKRGGFTKDEQKFFNILAAAVAKGISSLTQINNTVFVGTRIRSGEFRVHMFTQDNPQILSRAIERYADVLIKAGITKIHSVTENTKIISLLQSLGYVVDSKKEGDKYAFTVEKAQ